MKRRETIVIPMPKTARNADGIKGRFIAALEATQFAVETAVKRIVALEKQNDGLAKLSKDQEIETSHLRLRVKRLEERERRRDDE